MFAQANELVLVTNGIVALGLLVSLGILLAVLVDEWKAGTELRRHRQDSAAFLLPGRGAPVLTVIPGGRAGEPTCRQPRIRQYPRMMHIVSTRGEQEAKCAARRGRN